MRGLLNLNRVFYILTSSYAIIFGSLRDTFVQNIRL